MAASMNRRVPEEKIKPFRLVKYFTFTGLVVIFLVTLILTILNTHWVKSMQRKKAEDYAHALIENLNHQVFIQFILPVGMKFGRVQLRNPDQLERMDNVVRSTLYSFKVEDLNIYSMNNTISYSFDEGRIGVVAVGGTALEQAKVGKSTSKLVRRGGFLEILLGIPKEVQLVTFAPLRWEEPLGRITDTVLGVVEIVQDLSEDYQTIFRIQILVVITCTVLMGALFVVLLFVVKRGEAIIEQRAEERLRLKEQLGRAERLSAMGEMAAGISHEIRNPLGIIRSSAELLKKKVAKIDPTSAIPDIIIEEATRLNGIITDFINFARPRSPKFSPCRVEDVLEKNLAFLAAPIAEKGYTIRKAFQEPPAGDHGRCAHAAPVVPQPLHQCDAVHAGGRRDRDPPERRRGQRHHPDRGRGPWHTGRPAREGLGSVFYDQGQGHRTGARDRQEHHRISRREHRDRQPRPARGTGDRDPAGAAA